MTRGITLTSPFIFAALLANISYAQSQTPIAHPLPFKSTPAQQQPKSRLEEKLTKDRENKGYFGFNAGSKTNTYKSLPQGATIRTMDYTRVQQGLDSLQRATQSLKVDNLIKIQSFSLPGIQIHQPNTSLQQLEMIIDKRVIQNFLNQQLTQFGPLASSWQRHLSSMEQIINQSNIDSIVDIPALSQNLFSYIHQNQLLAQAQADWSQMENIDWSTFSIYDFINEDALQSTLNELTETANLNQVSAQNFLDQTQTQMDQTFQSSLANTLSNIRQSGFSLDNGKLNFQDPNNPNNRFSFTPGNSTASGSCFLTSNGEFSGSFVLNAGDCLTLQGSANFSTQGTLNTLANHGEQTVQNIVSMLQEGLQNGSSLDQMLSQLQGELNQISNSALPSVIQAIKDNFESDFSLTLNLQKVSDGFSGTGDYQYIDIILQTLGHDVGSITLNKRQIIDIATLMMNGEQSRVGEYILEDVAGYETDIVGYNIARDVANTYLSEHFQGNIIALQMGITQGGGMIQTGPTYYGSVLLRDGPKSRWVATGSFNQRSINNSPVLKEDGLLHLRTELVSNSLGIAYIPKIWNNPSTKTNLTGIVQVEGLFIRAHAASILTKTNLTESNNWEVVELYKIPLQDIEGATETYIAPMISVGANLQQEITRGLTVNGYVISYPGLAQQGNLTEIAQSIVPKYQVGASFMIRMESLSKPKPRLPSRH